MNKIANDLVGTSVPAPLHDCIRVTDRIDGLAGISAPEVAMICWQRALPEGVLDWLAGLDPVHLPHMRRIVPVAAVAGAVNNALHKVRMPKGPGREFLIQDIGDMATRFAAIMKVPYLRLRLNAVDTDSCRRFHVDSVRARMVCTYRGPGSQYGFAKDGAEPEEIFSVDTGVPMLLRGLEWRESPVSHLVHRSPPIEGTGMTRLVLVLDPIENPDEEL